MEHFRPVNVNRLYRVIADQIIDKIARGVYVTGSRLPAERELAEQLSVSRTSVREALIALEVEGYVDVRVGNGVFVVRDQPLGRSVETLLGNGVDIRASGSHPSYADVGAFELLYVQLLIEPEAAALAAGNGTALQKQAIAEAARLMEDSDRPRLHNRNYHLAIGEATGNSALALTIRNIWDIHDESVMFNTLEQHLVGRAAWAKAEDEHRAITSAILTGDAEAARIAMRVHTERTSRRLGSDFAAKQPA